VDNLQERASDIEATFEGHWPGQSEYQEGTGSRSRHPLSELLSAGDSREKQVSSWGSCLSLATKQKTAPAVLCTTKGDFQKVEKAAREASEEEC